MRLRIRFPNTIHHYLRDLREHHGSLVNDELYNRAMAALDRGETNPIRYYDVAHLDVIEWADVVCSAWCDLLATRFTCWLCTKRGHTYTSDFVDVENGREEFLCTRCGHSFTARF